MRAITELVKNPQVTCKSNAPIKDNFLKRFLERSSERKCRSEQVMKIKGIFDHNAAY